jgi:predicted CxxxxCH...CXXCH cytochrome family protein
VQGTSAITGQHVDGNIDVYDASAGDLGYPQDKTKNTAYDTCDNINCHGSASPTWGQNNTGDTCTTCHGTWGDAGATEDKIAPPVDTNGDTAATDAQVGAHQAHLATPSNISNSNSMNCSLCHTKPTNVFDSGHLDASLSWDGQADISMGSLATNNGAEATYGSSTCTNVYCHNEAKFPTNNHTNGGTGLTPSWNDTTYLGTTPLTSTDCNKCHYYDGGQNCSGCHYVDTEGDFVGTDDVSFANKELHIDGTVTAKGNCDSCHGFPPMPADGYSNINSTGGKGAHWAELTNGAHIDNGTLPAPDATSYSTALTQCYRCHPMSDSSHPENDGGADVQVRDDIYTFDGGSPVYNGKQGADATIPKTCSNVSCHFGNETPRWSCPSDPVE